MTRLTKEHLDDLKAVVKNNPTKDAGEDYVETTVYGIGIDELKTVLDEIDQLNNDVAFYKKMFASATDMMNLAFSYLDLPKGR